MVVGCARPPGHTSDTHLPADVPRTDRPLRSDSDAFRFVVLADRTGGARRGVFDRAVDQVRRLRPDFVLSVGDLIEGYTDDRAKLAAEWEEIDSMVDRFEVPFFYTVGNHDLSNPTMREVWRERYGREYWAFVHRGVLFLSLSTEDPPIELSPDVIARKARFERLMNEDPERVERMLAERAKAGPPKELPSPIGISADQVAFVEATLAENTDVRWTIVLMHKPAWKQDDPGFTAIEGMIADRPYTVIAGHEHSYAHTTRNGRDYYVLGTTGGVWISRGPGAMDHVMWGTMTEKGPELVPVRLDGILERTGPQPVNQPLE